MPLPDICNECDKMADILDYRGLCDRCAEKEDANEENERSEEKENVRLD